MLVETTDTVLNIAEQAFNLQRLPKRPLELLRAWDAADEYLLDVVLTGLKPSTSVRMIILNDSFGALALGLNAYQPQLVSDSYLSQQATRLNLQANQLPEHSVTLLDSLAQFEGLYDVVLIKAPKTLALLEEQLIRLHPHLQSSTRVILAGMIKTLPASVWKLLERLVGPTTTSLAKKKARLIFATPDLELKIPSNPYPVYYQLEGTEYSIGNHANVFSRDSLDIGTRFFLQHLPQQLETGTVVDLGCGNGLLGLMIAAQNPNAQVHFVDESFMAVASAQDNFNRALGLAGREATFTVADGLESFESDSVDCIVCNPPFHQQNTIGDQIANSMIKASKRVLKQGGELWIVGNRHLNYHLTVKQLFGNCTTLATNNKFVILKTKRLR
jgi:16S rRNA (guanine1207-N2)-methyltransferase